MATTIAGAPSGQGRKDMVLAAGDAQRRMNVAQNFVAAFAQRQSLTTDVQLLRIGSRLGGAPSISHVSYD
jgi:hypothetical protein